VQPQRGAQPKVARAHRPLEPRDGVVGAPRRAPRRPHRAHLGGIPAVADAAAVAADAAGVTVIVVLFVGLSVNVVVVDADARPPTPLLPLLLRIRPRLGDHRRLGVVARARGFGVEDAPPLLLAALAGIRRGARQRQRHHRVPAHRLDRRRRKQQLVAAVAALADEADHQFVPILD